MRATSRILAVSLALACVLVGAAPRSLAASDAAIRARVNQIVRDMLSQSPARGTAAGVVVVRAGTTIHARNLSASMVPASLLKVLTTTAALEKFGPSATFATRVLASAPAQQGVLGGPLYMVGGGDPTFATRAFASKYFVASTPDGSKTAVFPKGSPTVEDLADKVAAAGVTSVKGDLIADESLFDSDRWQKGWKSSYQHPGDVDVGNISAMTVNMGMDGDSQERVSSNPAATAAKFLSAALSARGVAISGTIRLGKAPAKTTELARVTSPPLRDIVGWTNRWSVNYPAEIVLKNLGAHFGGAGTTKASVAVVRSALTSKRVPLDGLVMEDGSGLSTLDRVQPRTIVTALAVALRSTTASGAAERDSLPVAGRPGTLLKRMNKAPTLGNLRGKTGLLQGTRGMAGWVRSSDGATLIYLVLFNHAQSPGALTSTLDYFGRSLAHLPT